MAILELSAVHPRDAERVGGKAASLARLVALDLPVPPGFVITADELDAFLEAHDLARLARQGSFDRVEAEIRKGPLPPLLAGELRRRAAELGSRVAVRSSAVGEDGLAASFAGQYDTVIGVAPGDETEWAVLACWASLFGARARAYAAGSREVASAPTAMGVVVQRQIASRCAGVLFTTNPMNGSWREMVVEAAWGQGESVVSGQVVPDCYVVARPRRSPAPVQRILARVRLDLVRDEVHEQTTQWVVDPQGRSERAVPLARVGAPKLRRAEVLRLCRLGLRIEAHSGGPQDVEWAQDEAGSFFVLQARPITTKEPVRRTAGEVLWTRHFLGERWTEPATPLGWSCMQPLLHHFIDYPETSRRYLGGAAPTRLFRFAPYVNATVFRHLSFKFPGAPPPRFMLELLPPAEVRVWRSRHAQAPDLAVYRSILAETFREERWKRFRWNPFTNWKAWEAYRVRLDQALRVLPRVRDAGGALERASTLHGLVRDYVKVHIASLLFANIWYEVADAALVSHGRVPADLLRPREETWTTRTNRALWHLGRGLLDEPTFLRDFGHRARSSWELMSPRWREDPELARGLARALAAGPEPESDVAPGPRALDGLPTWVRTSVVLAQRYLQLREDQRYHFDRLQWAWKEAYIWLAAHFDKEVRYLEAPEVEALVAGTLIDPDALIERRKSAWLEEVGRRAAGDEPPDFLLGEEVATDPTLGGRLEGIGISAGLATGPVRIVRSLDDAALVPGEILVARATEPGWTPLFVRAGGLVMELGGALSHGAVVAREYGLPAVANVQGATHRLQDGQVVTVDGNRGIVWVR